MAKPKLTITVQPTQGHKAFYLPLAPKSLGASERLKIALRLKITNRGRTAVTVVGIAFLFPDSTIGGETMQGEQLAIDPEGGVIERAGTATWSNGTVDIGVDDFKYNQVYLDAPAPPKIKVNVYCDGFTEPDSVTMDLIPWVDPTGDGPVRMPFAVTNLEYNEYLITSAAHFYNGGSEGHQIFAHDFGVERQDPSGGWSQFHPNTEENKNSHYLVFGMPVRAIADGIVFKVEDKWSDTGRVQIVGDPADKGGNHVWVRHGNLEVKYAHLRRHSIIVSKDQTVDAGQKLGEVGNSGNTNGIPHLHLECRDTATGTLRGFTFKSAEMLEKSQVRPVGSLPWVRLRENGICEEQAAIRPHDQSSRPSGPSGPGIPELERLVAEVFGGVSKDGGGFVVVRGKFIRVPPRGPMWALVQSLIALDAAEQIEHSSSSRIVREIADTIAKISKDLGKQRK